eukprot:scaffold1503_cov120-Isochrysis_galbana.AAC.14
MVTIRRQRCGRSGCGRPLRPAPGAAQPKPPPQPKRPLAPPALPAPLPAGPELAPSRRQPSVADRWLRRCCLRERREGRRAGVGRAAERGRSAGRPRLQSLERSERVALQVERVERRQRSEGAERRDAVRPEVQHLEPPERLDVRHVWQPVVAQVQQLQLHQAPKRGGRASEIRVGTSGVTGRRKWHGRASRRPALGAHASGREPLGAARLA